MNNQNIVELCNKIYSKHKYALDLIYENKLDLSSYIYQSIIGWLGDWSKEGLIVFDKNRCGGKSWFWFHTAAMNEIVIPEADKKQSPKVGYRDGSYYIYAIENRLFPSRIVLQFTSKELSGDNFEKVSRLQQTSLNMNKPVKEGWTWNLFHYWKLLKPKQPIETFDDFEQIQDKLKDHFYKIITKDIPAFEKRIAAELAK